VLVTELTSSILFPEAEPVAVVPGALPVKISPPTTLYSISLSVTFTLFPEAAPALLCPPVAEVPVPPLIIILLFAASPATAQPP